MVKFSLTGLIVAAGFMASAQITPVVRTELTYERDFQPLGIHNCGEYGIIVSASLDPKKAERDPDRLYIMYDTSLIETQSLEVEVPFRQKLVKTYQGPHTLHTLYYDARFGNGTVMSLTPQDTFPKKSVLKMPKRILIDEFAVNNNTALFTELETRKDVLYQANLKTGAVWEIDLPGTLKRKNLEILDVSAFKDGSGLGVVIREFNRTVNNTFLMTIDEDGQKEYVLPLKTDDLIIVQAAADRLSDGRFIVSGTYSENSTTSAKGMFLAVYDDVEMKFFATRSFGTFENFFDYMSSHGQQAIERRKERYEEHGKEMDVTVNMYVHPVLESENELILLGEVYYPTYRNLSTATTYIQGRPSTNSVRQFDGYEYTHAAVCKFDLDGHFKGDHCFPIHIWHKPYELKNIVNMYAHDTILEMVYMNDNYLQNKAITPSEEFSETVVLEADSTDQIRYTVGEVNYWYGNYFIATGFQNIRNTGDIRIRRKRDVFYLQKLEVR